MTLYICIYVYMPPPLQGGARGEGDLAVSYIILYYIILYHIISYFIILYHIIIHYSISCML